MIKTKFNNNLWAKTANPVNPLPPLEGDIKADLIIVGGGFTGCSAALEASKNGLSVVLLEAETIGFGGSGRNVGLVNAGLWTPPNEVEDVLGKDAGEKLNTTLAAAPDLVFSLIDKYQIDCDATRNGTLHCAHSKSGLVDLQSRFDQQTERNAPVDLLSQSDTKLRTGSNAFHGALFDPRAGTIQPLSYCLGLATAAIGKTAQLFEKSPVTQIVRENQKWLVKTERGTATAPNIIVATNAYTNGEVPEQQPQFSLVHYFQLATEPLTQTERQNILPALEGCWDTAMVMSSFRFDRDGRFLLGSVGSLNHAASSAHKFWAQKKLAALYPQLAGKKLDYAWHGRIAMTKDHLPKIVEFGPNAYSVFGYSGRGIGPGTVFGTALARSISTGDKSHLPVAPLKQYREQMTSLSSLYYEAGATLTHGAFAIGRKMVGR
ncbi:NAD(P)/FAD-dependent oxidoreductase [Maritalea sp.]|uniref:NAD(P)/FAD-dependent oxidoreductase n=1 Tax=Maritalea sp. TaxID=2003361 RepID=UPI003EF5FAF3